MSRHFTRVLMLLALLALTAGTACFVRSGPGRSQRGVHRGHPQKGGKWKKPKKHKKHKLYGEQQADGDMAAPLGE